MLVTVARRPLLEALELARKWIVPTKASPPIHHDCLLRTSPAGLEFVRSDFDHQVVARIDAAVRRHGEAIVAAHALYRIAKTSRATALQLTLAGGEHPRLEIAVGPSTYWLRASTDSEAFPELLANGEPFGEITTLPASTLRWLLGAVAYTAGGPKSPTDSLQLTFRESLARAVATDGRRAAVADLVLGAPIADLAGTALEVFLLAESAARLLALKAECMVTLFLADEHLLRFELGKSTTLSCRTFDRVYPDINATVERLDQGEPVTVQREPLLAALDRAAAILCLVSDYPVTLRAEDDQLTVSGDDGEGASLLERMPALAAGPGREISVNAELASEALAALNSSEVSLRIGPESMSVRPVLQEALTERQVAVLMRLNRHDQTDGPGSGERVGSAVLAAAHELVGAVDGDGVTSMTLTVAGHEPVTITHTKTPSPVRKLADAKAKRTRKAGS